jgi:hypothetical protein
VNVRGVETTYNTPETMFVTIVEATSFVEYFFGILESYIAFLIAFLIIMTSAFQFPFYLVPISLAILGVFLFFVY